MRIRTLLLAATLAGGALLVASSPAHAAKPFKITVTCDTAADTITVGTTGGTFVPSVPVKVVFQTLRTNWSTATADKTTGPETPVTRSATTDSRGELNVAGFTQPWNDTGYDFYAKTVQATVQTPQGGYVTQVQGYCTHDLRTVVTLDCDREAKSITARARGTRFARNTTVYVEYTYSVTSQATADDPRFTSHNTTPPDYSHTVQPANGDWSDLGYSHAVKTDPYYLSETVRVEVRSPFGPLLGRGTATCVYSSPA